VIFHSVKTPDEAEHHLKQLDITWTQKITTSWFKPSHYGKPKVVESPHIHFMCSREKEVGYFTQIFKTLVIFDPPRTWGEKSLENAYQV
jgi:hypothetical protein